MGEAEAVVAAGVALHKLPDWSEDTQAWAALRSAIPEGGVWMGLTEKRTYRILVVGRLSESVGEGVTLEAQASSVVDWALRAIDRLTSESATEPPVS